MPVAVPDEPVELLQVTDVTSADAVPLMAMAAAEVETIVNPGDVIFKPGGAPDAGAGLDGGGAVGGGETGFPGLGGFPNAACRVTVTTREAIVPTPSMAVTVMMFVPTFNGTTGMLQIDVPPALPDVPWLLVHVTCGLPVPPVTVPDMAMDDVVTIIAVAFGDVTVTTSAGVGGVAAGAA